MIQKIDYEKIKKEERKIGNTASKMVRNSILKELLAFGLIDTSELKKSIKIKPIFGELRLFRINIKMARYGYILEQGVNRKRTGHSRLHLKSKLYYTVREHTMRLQKKPFITQGIYKSGAFEYAFSALGKTRMKEFLISFRGINIKIE